MSTSATTAAPKVDQSKPQHTPASHLSDVVVLPSGTFAHAHLPSVSAEQRNLLHTKLAHEAVERAKSKVEAEKTLVEPVELGVDDILPFTEESSPLHELCRACEFYKKNGLGAQGAQRISQLLSQLPYHQRVELFSKLGIESPRLAGLQQALEKITDVPTQQFAEGLPRLSKEERILLLSRLNRSSDPNHKALYVYALALEEFDNDMILRAAQRPQDLQKIIKEFAKGIVTESGVFQAFREKGGKTAERMPTEAELIPLLKQAQEHPACVFARAYTQIATILNQYRTDPAAQKQHVAQVLQQLPVLVQNQLYIAIYETHRKLNPDMAAIEQLEQQIEWGTAHACDKMAVLLQAISANCPRNEAHPIYPLFLAAQEILCDPKLSWEAKKAKIKDIMAKAMTLPEDVRGAFRGMFYQTFPEDATRKTFGFRKEESVAHNFPFHLLACWQQMMLPYATEQHWEMMQKEVSVFSDDGFATQENLVRLQDLTKVLPMAAGDALMQGLVVRQGIAGRSTQEAFWPCFNAVEARRRASRLGDLVKHPLFFQLWHKSPLCEGLRTGREEAIDEGAQKELHLRLERLERLQGAKNLIVSKGFVIDQPVWDAVIQRVIMQPGELDDNDLDGIQVMIDALEDIENAPGQYDPAGAQAILQHIADLTSRHIVGAKFQEAIRVRDIRHRAFADPLKARPLDDTGPKKFKALFFVKDPSPVQGKKPIIRGKTKIMDALVETKGGYRIRQLSRELMSYNFDSALGFPTVVPTGIIRLTLGEGILHLTNLFLTAPQVADEQFNQVHPYLRDAIKRDVNWSTMTPKEKQDHLLEFYHRSGSSAILQVLRGELQKGTAIEQIKPLFDWLPLGVQAQVFKGMVIARGKQAQKDLSPSYGLNCFFELKPHTVQFTSTPAQKIQALEIALKEMQRLNLMGLQPTDAQGKFRPETMLGTIQPWTQNATDVTSFLREEDRFKKGQPPQAAAALLALPQETVAHYILSLLARSHGDAHTCNTLMVKSRHPQLAKDVIRLSDCDEEHAFTDENDFYEQIMWPLGLPQSAVPVQPLILRLLVHPQLHAAVKAILRDPIPVRAGSSYLQPYREAIQEDFHGPMESLRERMAQMRGIAKQAIQDGRPITMQDLFFEVYGGREKYAGIVKQMPVCPAPERAGKPVKYKIPVERLFVAFEHDLTVGAAPFRIRNARRYTWDPENSYYAVNIVALSRARKAIQLMAPPSAVSAVAVPSESPSEDDED